jgi:hypothetical protein
MILSVNQADRRIREPAIRIRTAGQLKIGLTFGGPATSAFRFQF